MGRLTEAVVTHSRAQVPDAPGMPDPPDPPDIVRTTQFTYHANQRLATERVAMNVAVDGGPSGDHGHDGGGDGVRLRRTARAVRCGSRRDRTARCSDTVRTAGCVDTVEGWASYMTVGGSTWIAIMGLTGRGFTGHQHVDRLDLIHMNGRTYDTKLGRFMQADIVVQSPFDTQSYNRYSYLMNNPLNGTDPSGYFSIKEYTSVIVAVGINWIVPGSGVWYQALVGATAGAAGAAANGGNILQGAAIGAFSGAVFAGINGPDSSLAWGAPGDIGQHALNIAANGVAGGAISVVQGGNFGHGFVSAGVTAAVMPGVAKNFKGVERVVVASVVGGTISELSGGKFANGAMTVAFMAAAAEASAMGPSARRGESGSQSLSSASNGPAMSSDACDCLQVDMGHPPSNEVRSLMALEQLFGFKEDVFGVRIVENDWRPRSAGMYATTRMNTIYLDGGRSEFFQYDLTVLEEYFHVLKQWNTRQMTRTSYMAEHIRNGYDGNRFEIQAKGYASQNLQLYTQLKGGI